MGLFDLFGGNKKKEEEAAALAEKRKEEEAIKEKEDQIAAHEGLEWPHPVPISRIRTQGEEPDVFEDPVSQERKDEIGPLVYEEKIGLDTLKFLTLPELLFVLTTLEFYNSKGKLKGFSENHRILYNELLNRVRDAKMIYCLYDDATKFPFIENGFAYIYLEKEIAQQVAAAYGKQYRKLTVKDCPAVPEGAESTDRGFFDYLYYLGIERIIIDNGRYRARFSRSEIVAPPDFGQDQKKAPMNPQLRLAMLDFLSEARWPVKYEKRAQVVQTKEARMVALARAGRYIVPIQHEGPAEMMNDGRIKFNKDTKLRFPVMKTNNGKLFLPIFTDGIEFSKKFGREGFEGAVFRFSDILRFVQDKDGLAINPMGENIMLPKDKMMALEAASRMMAESKNAGKTVNEANAQDIIKRASAEDVADKIIQMPKRTQDADEASEKTNSTQTSDSSVEAADITPEN